MNSPNILLFIMDACQAEALESGSDCLTPNFDRLRDLGVDFKRAYCPSPTCSPSRASLMTGVLPHNHGVLEVEHGRDFDQCNLRTDLPHWAQRLSEAGYHTGYFGKWHIERSGDLGKFGWDEFHAKGAAHHSGLGKGVEPSAAIDDLLPEYTRYHSGPEGYRDILHYGVSQSKVEDRYPDYTTNQALGFLSGVAKEAPSWCLCASFSEPNEALVAAEEIFRKYDPESISLPGNVRDTYEDRPGLYRRQRKIAESVSDDEWRMARACYYSRITELDQHFGRLLDSLEAMKALEDTVVIVTADHGRYVGAHGFDAHNFGPFEEIYRVPLLMAGPGIEPGTKIDSPVGLHDLCPTIVEMSGSAEINVADSESLVPLLKGNPGLRRGMYAESQGTRFSLTQRIWWEGDWKFVFNGFDCDELYDLKSDPLEMKNLAECPGHLDRVKAMMKEVWKEIKNTGDRALAETQYFSMRMGIVGPGED